MIMTYLRQPPKRYTFEQPKLKAWVEHWCNDGLTLNLFAGKVELNVDEVRVDVDCEMPADYHMDAYEFVERDVKLRVKYNTVVLDPPYNIRKAIEKYEGRWIGKLTKIKNLLPDLLEYNGRVITLGYDTVGMSASRGFEKLAVCVICHSGDHNDTLAVVERKVK